MKCRRSGGKYRNLTLRGGVIYYERVRDGKRDRFSCETAEWAEAAAIRDRYEERLLERKAQQLSATLPSLRDFAVRYLAEDTGHLAPTTKGDRESALREDGPLLGYFGDTRLEAITSPALREWWGREIQRRGFTLRTGRGYVDVLSAVLGFARDLWPTLPDPIPAFRATIRRRSRTQKARAEAEAGAMIHPIESAAGLRKLVEATEAEAGRDFSQEREVQRGVDTKRVRTLEERTGGLRGLAALDAGLRMGEVAGLTWGQVRWGESEDDLRRALVIDRSRARGREEGPPKSGRTRTVALSRRLRRALARLYEAQWRPGPEARVFPGFDPRNFGQRRWALVAREAGLGHHTPKDLRDTFASWLLSLGVQLGYVSRQLGHADVAVTAKHYAKWVEGDAYREPMTLLPGEVPADLLARVVEGAEERWSPGRESNPRLDVCSVAPEPLGDRGVEADSREESPHYSPQLHNPVSNAETMQAENMNENQVVTGGGACRARTCDLRGVNTALCQLS